MRRELDGTPVLNSNEARQGVEIGVVRLVLATSLLLAVMAGLGLAVYFS